MHPWIEIGICPEGYVKALDSPVLEDLEENDIETSRSIATVTNLARTVLCNVHRLAHSTLCKHFFPFLFDGVSVYLLKELKKYSEANRSEILFELVNNSQNHGKDEKQDYLLHGKTNQIVPLICFLFLRMATIITIHPVLCS